MKALTDNNTVVLTMTIEEAKAISSSILKAERELAEEVEAGRKEGFCIDNREARRKILDEAFFALLKQTS